jgi:hypothetical protein
MRPKSIVAAITWAIKTQSQEAPRIDTGAQWS